MFISGTLGQPNVQLILQLRNVLMTAARNDMEIIYNVLSYVAYIPPKINKYGHVVFGVRKVVADRKKELHMCIVSHPVRLLWIGLAVYSNIQRLTPKIESMMFFKELQFKRKYLSTPICNTFKAMVNHKPFTSLYLLVKRTCSTSQGSFGFSLWEKRLPSNASSHWLSPYSDWSLHPRK